MSNYNEALETEKRTLSLLVETSFYQPVNNTASTPETNDTEKAMAELLTNPQIAKQILQLLQNSAVSA